MLRSPAIRVVLGVAGVIVLYLLGVVVRQHYGSCVDIQNKSTQTIRQLNVTIANGGKSEDIPDMAPGDHRRVYVQPTEASEVTVRIDDGMRKPRDITVFGHLEHGVCDTAKVQILPQHNTQTDELDRATCWGGWFDFM
jgi:hypothetical protein